MLAAGQGLGRACALSHHRPCSFYWAVFIIFVKACAAVAGAGRQLQQEQQQE
jgi:hypothetical protein